MPSFSPGNKSPRKKPWRARVQTGSRWAVVRVWHLGYFETRKQAQEVEDRFREHLQKDP